MKSSIQERDDALSILETQAHHLSTVFRKSYLSKKRGALPVYTEALEDGRQISTNDYRTKKESINLFDNKKSRNELSELISNYDPNKEGILMVITKSIAVWFVVFKLTFRK